MARTPQPLAKRRIPDAARRRFFNSRHWRRLTAPGPEEVERGTVFRFPACAPREPMVDCLLVDHPGESGLGVLVTSGKFAGTVTSALPSAALMCATMRGAAHTPAVSRSWVIANWRRYFYEGCGPRDVMVADRYPTPR